MRTQVMQEFVVGNPWLEYDPPGGVSEKTLLQTLPFTIGRNDAADLHIDSNQVSREHAVITRHGKKYRVRDLGSTNGTFLNGEQIEEATLSDGDLLVIADVEFTFFCGTTNTARQTATQLLHSPSPGATKDVVWDTIFAIRRTHEIASQRCLRTLFQPIVRVAGGELFGHEALVSNGADDFGRARGEQLTTTTESRAGDRLRKLFRRLAVEDAKSLRPADHLMLAITAAETAEPWLLGHLTQLRDLLGSSRQLIVEVADNAVHSTDEFRALLANLKAAQLLVAYDGYASGKAQIADRLDIMPDYLKLAPSVFRSMHRSEDRRRQVQMTVRASQDAGCVVVATGIDSEADCQACRDLGCTLAQGDQFGRPQSISAALHPARVDARARESTK